MRLTLAGKIVLYLAVLAGLYALWTYAPRQAPHVELPAKPPEAPQAAPEPSPATHTGIRIGYVGAPPALDAAALKDADAALEEMPGIPETLSGLESGALDAAVVDFPAVVYASRAGATPFHTVLLVSWRAGADVITVKAGGPWRPAGWTDFAPRTSGEYLARLALDSSRYSPQEKAAGRRQMDARAKGGGSTSPDAAAGRRDRMSPAERGWPAFRTSEDFNAPMPDVLVVNTKWARKEPDSVVSLVRGFRAGQDRLVMREAAWKDLVRERARSLGVPEESVEEQVRPASLEDQLAFVGLAREGMKYTEVAFRQLSALEAGPRPPSDVTVLVDSAPLLRAAQAASPGP